MSPTKPVRDMSSVRDIDRRVVVLALLATIASMLVAWLHPGRVSLGPSEISWIAAQAFLLTIPGFVVARLVQKRKPLMASLFGSTLVLAVPALMLLDAITFHWIGDRFLSPAIWLVVTDLRSALVGHVTGNIDRCRGDRVAGFFGHCRLVVLDSRATCRCVGQQSCVAGANTELHRLPLSLRTYFDSIAGQLPAYSADDGERFFPAPAVCHRVNSFSWRR